MGILAKWFGQVGIVRFEGTVESGRHFTAKCRLESFNTTTEAVEEYLKRVVFAETGKRVKTLRVLTFVEI